MIINLPIPSGKMRPHAAPTWLSLSNNSFKRSTAFGSKSTSPSRVRIKQLSKSSFFCLNLRKKSMYMTYKRTENTWYTHFSLNHTITSMKFGLYIILYYFILYYIVILYYNLLYCIILYLLYYIILYYISIKVQNVYRFDKN